MRVKWRGLELPNRLTSDRDTLTDTYGKFYAEPFERGFGMTVGNSLRASCCPRLKEVPSLG